jgi:hypothetical protein
MDGFRLRDGVSFCRIGERHLFFDVHADRYFGLTDPLDRSFADMTAQDVPEAGDAELLLRTGLVIRAREDVRPKPCIHATVAPERVIAAATRSSPRTIAGVLARRLLWSHRVKHRSLSDNLDALTRRRDRLSSSQTDPAPLARRVRGYSDAALLWSESGRCLATSMALMDDLTRLGYRVKLVFAVRLDPFFAHCWVEWQAMPICPDPDALRALTPIRIV